MQNGRGKSKYSAWTHDDLVQFRTNAGISRREMSEDLGVSYRMYCYYESGHTKIDLPLEYAVRWLVNSREDKPSVEKQSEGTLSAFQKERISRLMNAIHNYPTSDLDEMGQKILSQCVDEISMLSEQTRSV
jgi:transcriptional regulator with XRE-family HTH domain